MSLYGTGSYPKTELLINNAWVDVSNRPRAEQKISITRGRSNEQARVAAQSCNLTMNNRDGVFSNRNPNSPYFGLLPRNTQLRVTAGSGDTYAKLLYSDVLPSGTAFVWTADKNVLDVTGDIDVRAEIQPYTWRPPTGGMNIMSKYALGSNQRSWIFSINQDGTLSFIWSTDGTAANRVLTKSTASVPQFSGRLAVRATVDVNNGASGNTVTFYTSSSISGTWTQLGSAVVTAGVSSIFSSSANLTIGGGSDNQIVITGNVGFAGKIYKAEVWNGIAGTRVANMDATSQAIGTTSWSDGLTTPNTWATSGTGTRVTSDRLRFWGELSSLPQVWDRTATDFYVPVQASGIIRRLTQGADPLSSPMYRNFSQYSPIGYWPFEDGSAATSAGSATASGSAGVATNVDFGLTDSTLPGTAGAIQFNDATSRIKLSCSRTASTNVVSFVFYVRLSSLPASTTVLASLYTTGTARRITVALSTTTWTTTFYAADGSVLATDNTNIGGDDPSKQWIGYNLLLTLSGSTLQYSIRWDQVGVTSGGVGPNSLGTGSTGVPTGGLFAASGNSAYYDAKLAHAFMSTTNFDLSNTIFRNASNAWLNETAADRLVRLATEEAVALEVTGIRAESEPMGYQLVDTFMNNVYDCVDTDGGMLTECRDQLALAYRIRTALEHRTDATFSLTASHLSDVPIPTEDDQNFTNDVTVTRTNGGSARVQNTDGSTSISAPPSGVGPYQTAITRNAAADARLPSLAGWAVLVGSWDESRYPQLQVGLHRNEIVNDAVMLPAVIGLENGDTAILSNLPSTQPPDPVPELIQGYTETLDRFLWTVTFNCTPAGPYLHVPVLGSDWDAIRLDATSHTIGSSLTTTGTSVTLVTPAGSQVWVDSSTYPAEFPFTAKIAGEWVTVTAISGTSSPQTATITRSVNGTVKTHSSGELIRLAVPYYLGR